MFGRWFRKVAAAPVGHPVSGSAGVQYTGVTPAACELLRAVDAGGVPGFVTKSLKQIARDNGIEVQIEWTPNEIVDAIRGKASDPARTLPAQ